MKTSVVLPVHTERLTLRRFLPTDFKAYADYHRRDDVYRFLYSSPPEADALAARFETLPSAPFENDGDTLLLAVIRQDDQTLLGEVLLKIASRDALQVEVGYIFNPDFSGKGYATEAVKAMINLGFDQIGCHRIFARLDALNHGSIGVVERLKLRKEAHLIQNDRFKAYGETSLFMRY